jgi:cation/acetate symporter
VIYETSWTAIGVFAFFVALVLGISFYLGAKAKSASGYYAAHGQIPWFVNGVAFAGDYLSAASFLGICGMIAFYGYDGFLYSIGYLAGWIVALLVIAEPLKRLGKFTFADALDSQFNSRGIKLAAAISTLVVSVFYLIPQMVGAGALVKPLLGLHDLPIAGFSLSAHATGVMLVGGIVILIVVTAGMVSTTWVQFIKGGLLVVFCTVLVGLILFRGLTDDPRNFTPGFEPYLAHNANVALLTSRPASIQVLREEGVWKDKPYLRTRDVATGRVRIWRKVTDLGQLISVDETQYAMVRKDGTGSKVVNGLPWGKGESNADFRPVGEIRQLPPGANRDVRYYYALFGREPRSNSRNTGPIDPFSFFTVLQKSQIVVWGTDKIEDRDFAYTIYYPKVVNGSDLLTPGSSPTFAGVRSNDWWKKLDFLSLMIALFCGTASLPHILIRYYTVKDQASARKSTVVGIASIGFFYVLTLFLGLGAMTSGRLDVTDSNMAAPLLARSFGELPFAVISAIAFTTVLGTVSGLIMAASGAVAHDLMSNFLGIQMNDHTKVRAGKLTAVAVGLVAIVLGILFGRLNVNFLVGWAFNIAASANLPALVMLLFWRGTTKQGITAAIFVGMLSSLAWILLSQQCYRDVYGLPPESALVPFSQPGIVTIPLGFAVLVGVSLFTKRS